MWHVRCSFGGDLSSHVFALIFFFLTSPRTHKSVSPVSPKEQRKSPLDTPASLAFFFHFTRDAIFMSNILVLLRNDQTTSTTTVMHKKVGI